MQKQSRPEAKQKQNMQRQTTPEPKQKQDMQRQSKVLKRKKQRCLRPFKRPARPSASRHPPGANKARSGILSPKPPLYFLYKICKYSNQ